MAKIAAKLPKFAFVREAYNEMKNVTWPSLRHVSIFTGLVVVTVVVLSYFISFVDRGFTFGLGEARVWLNPESAQIENTQPQIQTTPGLILDSKGNEIKVDSVLTPEQLENIELQADTKPPQAQ